MKLNETNIREKISHTNYEELISKMWKLHNTINPIKCTQFLCIVKEL